MIQEKSGFYVLSTLDIRTSQKPELGAPNVYNKLGGYSGLRNGCRPYSPVFISFGFFPGPTALLKRL